MIYEYIIMYLAIGTVVAIVVDVGGANPVTQFYIDKHLNLTKAQRKIILGIFWLPAVIYVMMNL